MYFAIIAFSAVIMVGVIIWAIRWEQRTDDWQEKKNG